MGWERRRNSNGRYYTRSRRVDGRVKREYIGGGFIGAYAAEIDAEARARRLAEADLVRQFDQTLKPLDQIMSELDAACALMAHATLLAAGFHQHDRGEWRFRHVRRDAAT
jgi:hypothetical protein